MWSTRVLIFSAAIIISAVVARAAPVRADDEAQALLAKHRAFMGWHLEDGTFKTLRLDREYINDKGVVTERSVERHVGLLYRNTYPVSSVVFARFGYV